MVEFMLSVVLLLAPTFRGLYGEKEMLFFQAVVAVVFGIFLFTQKKFRRFNYMDIAATAFVTVYILSLTVAFDHRDAFITVLRYISYLMVYLIVAQKAVDIQYRRRLFLVVLGSGVISVLVLMVNLLSTDSVLLVWLDNIVQTTFEYKNSGAMFLLLCSLIGIYFWINYDSKIVSLLSGACNYLFVLVIITTQSRTVWLLIPVAYMLLLVGLKRGQRLSIFIKSLITVATAVVFGSKMLNLLIAESNVQAVLLALFGLLLTILILFLWNRLINEKIYNITSLQCVIIIGFLGVIIAGGIYLSPEVSARLKSISFLDDNVSERLVMYQDALKIFRNHRLLGSGGRGWAVSYINVQSYAYYAEQVHNQFLQVMVETGLTGLLTYLSLWTTFYFRVFNKLRNMDSENKEIAWLVLVLASVLMLHTIIDFDLAFGALSFILWVLFGVVSSDSGTDAVGVNSKGREIIIRTVGLVLSLITIIFSLLFFAGNIYITKGDDSANTGDLTLAKDYYLKALSFDPYNAPCEKKLAKVFLDRYGKKGDINDLNEAINYCKKTIRHRPTAPFVHSVYSSALYFKGDYSDAVIEAEKFTSLYPLQLDAYEQLAFTHLNIGMMLRTQGNNKLADQHFRKVLQVPQMIKTRMDQIPQNILELWFRKAKEQSPILYFSPLLKVYTGGANLFLNQHDEGRKLISEALNEHPDGTVLLWNSVLQYREHHYENSRQLLKQASAFEPEALKKFEFITGAFEQHKFSK